MKRVFAFLGALLLSSVAVASATNKSKPNIIFSLSDDQRYDSLGIMGEPVTQTLNLDRLAREGVIFNHSHPIAALQRPRLDQPRATRVHRWQD